MALELRDKYITLSKRQQSTPTSVPGISGRLLQLPLTESWPSHGLMASWARFIYTISESVIHRSAAVSCRSNTSSRLPAPCRAFYIIRRPPSCRRAWRGSPGRCGPRRELGIVYRGRGATDDGVSRWYHHRRQPAAENVHRWMDRCERGRGVKSAGSAAAQARPVSSSITSLANPGCQIWRPRPPWSDLIMARSLYHRRTVLVPRFHARARPTAAGPVDRACPAQLHCLRDCLTKDGRDGCSRALVHVHPEPRWKRAGRCVRLPDSADLSRSVFTCRGEKKHGIRHGARHACGPGGQACPLRSPPIVPSGPGSLGWYAWYDTERPDGRPRARTSHPRERVPGRQKSRARF